jgi:putative tributyrin esterase
MIHRPHLRCGTFVAAILLLAFGCSHRQPPPDRPRVSDNERLQDVTFYSSSLGRMMQYRVILPSRVGAGQMLAAIYLLHGGGGGFRDWSNYSDVARFADSGLLLVMPEGNSSYYVNAVSPAKDRYEDYVTGDLISDVESRFPAVRSRDGRAIVGVSMGGFGAITLALRHPDLYAFAGGLSSAVDVPRRAFSIRRLEQSRHFEAIFGAAGSPSRRDRDPFLLVRSASPQAVPFFFLTCGEQESLLPPNREFAALLAQRRFRYEFHTMPGHHDWNQWNAWLPQVFESWAKHAGTRS